MAVQNNKCNICVNRPPAPDKDPCEFCNVQYPGMENSSFKCVGIDWKTLDDDDKIARTDVMAVIAQKDSDIFDLKAKMEAAAKRSEEHLLERDKIIVELQRKAQGICKGCPDVEQKERCNRRIIELEGISKLLVQANTEGDMARTVLEKQHKIDDGLLVLYAGQRDEARLELARLRAISPFVPIVEMALLEALKQAAGKDRQDFFKLFETPGGGQDAGLPVMRTAPVSTGDGQVDGRAPQTPGGSIDEATREKVKNLIINGLEVDGDHHKQWYLEQILVALGYDLLKVKQEENKDDYDWEPGIPP